MSIKKVVIFSYAIDVEITNEELQENLLSPVIPDDDIGIESLTISKAEKIWEEINPKIEEMNVEVEDGE